MSAEVTCYLDHNATSPLRPEAAAAVLRAQTVSGNPSSVHAFGRAARRLVEESRARVAWMIGARPEQVIFTSGGTESNNLALRGCGRRRIIASAIEHPSVLDAAEGTETVDAGADGVVLVDALSDLLARNQEPAVVSVMLANNETGVVQPVREIVELARVHGALVHCDAVQAPGRILVDWTALGVDMMSLSAHKLGGPRGVGALVLGDNLQLSAIARGGGQERGRRSGTENVSGIAGFGAVAEIVQDDLANAGGLARLRDRLEERVRQEIPAARIVAQGSPRLPNTSCIALPHVSAELQVMSLDLEGIAVSAGSACSSGKVATSHVLRAMGLSADIAGCAIRVSLGHGNTADDVDRFVTAWKGVAERAGRSAA